MTPSVVCMCLHQIAAHRPRGRAQLPPSAGHVHHGPAASEAEFKVDEVLEEFRFKLEQVRRFIRALLSHSV